MDYEANKDYVKQTIFKNFKKHGYRADDKSRLDIFRQECKKAIDNSREMYLKQMGLNLADPDTGKKSILEDNEQGYE